MEVIKDLFSIPKSKGEFFWKGFIIGCIIRIGIVLLMLLSWNNFGEIMIFIIHYSAKII